MNNYLLVFVGGGIGSMLRLGTYRFARLWLSPEFPWGTFAVNVIGGLVAGLVTGWLMSRSAGGNDPAGLFLMTGVLGGFTTFSAFSVDAVLLFEKGQLGVAAAYVAASFVFAIVGVLIGLAAVRSFA
ncbi:MAG: fluoride efflux transporter CrcB [Sphingomicrobium sp.]